MNSGAIWNDYMQIATLTATTAATSFESGYCKDNSPKKGKLKFNALSGTLLIDCLTAVSPETLIIRGSNMLGSTTFTIQAGTTTACTDSTVKNISKTEDSELDMTAFSWAAYRYYLITFLRPSGDYPELKQIFLAGENDTFTKNFLYHYKDSKKSIFDLITGSDGQKQKIFRYSLKVLNGNFKQIGDTQKELFDESVREESFIYFYESIKAAYYFGTIEFSECDGAYINSWDMSFSFEEAR